MVKRLVLIAIKLLNKSMINYWVGGSFMKDQTQLIAMVTKSEKIITKNIINHQSANSMLNKITK